MYKYFKVLLNIGRFEFLRVHVMIFFNLTEENMMNFQLYKNPKSNKPKYNIAILHSYLNKIHYMK